MLHRIGNVYQCSDTRETYILAQVDMGKVALIELSEGNRYIRPVKIRSEVYDISAEDWQKICNEWPEKFEYLGKFVRRATHENSSIGYSVCDKSVPAPDKAM